MSQLPPLVRIAELQQLIADFAKVKRVPHLADTNRAENDVEHSYGLALTCWYLQPKIAPELNLTKIFMYALAHDIVELHAGDTYFIDEVGLADKEQRERDAITKLREDWPDFTDIIDHAEGYMDKADEEAKFVKAVDKLLPAIMIELAQPNQPWSSLGITLDIERENKVSIRVSDYLAPYYEKLIAWLEERDTIPRG